MFGFVSDSVKPLSVLAFEHPSSSTKSPHCERGEGGRQTLHLRDEARPSGPPPPRSKGLSGGPGDLRGSCNELWAEHAAEGWWRSGGPREARRVRASSKRRGLVDAPGRAGVAPPELVCSVSLRRPRSTPSAPYGTLKQTQCSMLTRNHLPLEPCNARRACGDLPCCARSPWQAFQM